MKKRVILFMSKPWVHLYYGRIEKYLLDMIDAYFYAETAEAFVEITRKSAGFWDVLVLDSTVAEENENLVNRFIDENPRAIVGIEYAETVPSSALVKNAVTFERPGDIDEWLATMHHLLGR